MKPLSGYIKEVLKIREELKDIIYFGEFIDNLQVQVEKQENTGYSVHIDPKTGKRACIVVNYSNAGSSARVMFEGSKSGMGRIYEPYKAVKSSRLPARVKIPGERFAIIVEE